MPSSHRSAGDLAEGFARMALVSRDLERAMHMLWIAMWWGTYRRRALSDVELETWRLRSQARSNAARYLRRKQREHARDGIAVIVSLLALIGIVASLLTGGPRW